MMFEPLDDNLEMRLRDGLRAQPAPDVSEDFDARVLAAVLRPEPWWRLALALVRAAAPAAMGSLVLTLFAANWVIHSPDDVPRAPAQVVEFAPVDIDAILRHPNLSGATMLSFQRDLRREKPVPVPDTVLPRRRSDLPVYLA